jgi:hypothetical protein
MAASFPMVTITDETIESYVSNLYDVPLAILNRATLAALETARFFPTIAEVREKADAMVARTVQAPAFSCPKCFGAGMEQYKDDLGYNFARRCYH